MSRQEILDNWIRIKADIQEIKDREEGLVLIGDMNRAIGSDILGVQGNHATVSFGGTLIRELLEDKDYCLVNSLDLVEGGPFTWVSRVDSSIQSCLDLVVLSANLLPFLTKMVVDTNQQYCPKRVGVRNNKSRVVKSDHHPIILSLENMPRSINKKPKSTRWNLSKPGGWEEYKMMTDLRAEEVDLIVENYELSVDVMS